MPRRSNKSITEVLRPQMPSELSSKNDINFLLEKKIAMATEGFTTSKFCELILRDRNRLSKENALTISEYIIVMKREVIKNSPYNYSRIIKGGWNHKEIH